MGPCAVNARRPTVDSRCCGTTTRMTTVTITTINNATTRTLALTIDDATTTTTSTTTNTTTTGPSLDRVSETLCLSHYATEISHLHSLRDF